MVIAGTGTALTDHVYTQDQTIDGFKRLWHGRDYNPNLVERFFKNVQVETRHLALPLEAYFDLADFTAANRVYKTVGLELAEQAVHAALASASVDASEIDAIFFTTVTGITVPTIDALLMNRIGFRRDVKRSPFFGLGCVAGVAGMARMADYLQAWPTHRALLLSVELCSLTLQQGDLSVAALIAAGLFGDGAAAVVGAGVEAGVHGNGTPQPVIVASASSFYHDSERVMGWEVGSGGFSVVLSAEVPNMVANYLRDDVDAFLAEQGLAIEDISSWVCHPGGPKVLTGFEEALGLPRDAFAVTWESLKAVGNLSSASVLFVLQKTLRDCQKPPGSYGVMIAMGPGFCAEFVLFRW